MPDLTELQQLEKNILLFDTEIERWQKVFMPLMPMFSERVIEALRKSKLAALAKYTDCLAKTIENNLNKNLKHE